MAQPELLHALATEALVREWVLYWAFILGAGSLPALTRRLADWPRTPSGRQRWRQYTSLLALLGCLLAWRPLADTWRLESGVPDAVRSTRCATPDVRAWGPVGRLRCADGRTFALRGAVLRSFATNQSLELAYLPSTGIVVQTWEAAPRAPAKTP